MDILRLLRWIEYSENSINVLHIFMSRTTDYVSFIILNGDYYNYKRKRRLVIMIMTVNPLVSCC